MKNIETILKDAGVEVDADQLAKINEAHKENYKPIADYLKQTDKIKSLEDTLTATQEQLKGFEGVDKGALEKQIKDLEKTIKDKEAEYTSKIADRDFNDFVAKAITEAKGKNTKAIMALLDLDKLKSSNNQQKDINDQLATLAEAEDSKMLFGDTVVGKADPIGAIGKNGGSGLSGVEQAFYDRTGIRL